MLRRFAKACRLLRRPSLLPALLGHGVAAAIEHEAALRRYRMATIIDVGAHCGQFSLLARRCFPDATIIAFEPIAAAADRYERIFAADPAIRLHRVAVASEGSRHRFFVTERSDSSSLRPPGPGQIKAFGSSVAAEITVPTARLDAILDTTALTAPVLLKIDAQGSELDVLQSLGEQITAIDYIYVEASYIVLYQGQPLINDIIRLLDERGFYLCGIFNQIQGDDFGPIQADFLFLSASAHARLNASALNGS